MQLDITLDLTLETPDNPLDIYEALTDPDISIAEEFDITDYDVTVNDVGALDLGGD